MILVDRLQLKIGILGGEVFGLQNRLWIFKGLGGIR